MNKELGTKWFTFYTGVRPLLALIFLGFDIIGCILQIHFFMISPWAFLYFAALVLNLVLCLMVSCKARGNYVSFVKFVKRVLILEVISTTYQISFEQYIKAPSSIFNAVFVGCISLVLFYFIWYRTNLNYFTRRILLTSTQSEAPTCIDATHISTVPANEQKKSSTYQCNKCKKEFESAFLYCPFCGTKKRSPKSPLTFQQICAISFGIIAAILLSVATGYFFSNYQRGTEALDRREFINAQRYFGKIPSSEKLFPQEWEYINAGVLMEQGDYREALEAFTNMTYPVPTALIKEVKDIIYKQAQEYYRMGQNVMAKRWFERIIDYERSSDYMTLISARQGMAPYSDVIKLVNFEDCADIILSSYRYFDSYLTGTWRTDDNVYYFKLDENGYISSNLPQKGYGSYYSLRNGIYSIGDNNRGYTNCFLFTIINETQLRIFCCQNNKSYYLFKPSFFLVDSSSKK